MDSKAGQANILANVGLIQWAKADLDSALKRLNESLDLFEDLGMSDQAQKTKENIKLISELKEELGEE